MMYFFLGLILFAFMLLYFKVADKFNIIDKPNNRSSHSQITIRGGGIIFPLAALLWFLFYGFAYPFFLIGLLLIAAISFIDDIVTLPNRSRILVHIVSVILLSYQTGIFSFQWYWWLIVIILTIGWINAFNFMDGINGITALYSLSALITFLFANYVYQFFSSDLIYLMTISVIIFAFFNARKKARTFAGDVGSVSMAFTLAFLMIRLLMTSGHWEYILFFAVYGVDAILTIVHRLLKRENIFEAHRSHLYQYLANEFGIAHIKVSALYFIIQLIINAALLWNSSPEDDLSLILPVSILALLIIIYIVTKVLLLQRLNKTESSIRNV